MLNPSITYFKTLYKTNDSGHVVSLEKAYKRIKSGISKDTVMAIRSAKTKEEQDTIKRKLPCILFAGSFRDRSDDSLIEHSGLCVLDFDKIPTDDFQAIRDTLTSNPHVVLVFTSPSGDGIKAVIRIPQCNKYEHVRYFKSFYKEYPINYFDSSSCNISRVCFESFDPDVYFNPNATIFDKLDESEAGGYSISDKSPVLPLSDESVIIDRLMKWWNKRYGFVKDHRNNNVFILACSFCNYGIKQDTAESYILHKVVTLSDDFRESECKTIVKSAYKKAEFGSRYFEDDDKKKRIKADLKHGSSYVLEQHKIDKATLIEIQETIDSETFWTIKETKGKVVSIHIDPYRYKHFLERNGFKKYFPEGSQKPTWVMIESNKVTETSVEKIKDFVMTYLEEKREFEVWNRMANYQREFSDTYLLMLDTIDLMMLKDTKTASYLAFRNGIVKITTKTVEFIDYIDIDAYVWKDHIIDRDFIASEDITNDFQIFVKNVSGGQPDPFESAIGYLSNTHKNKVNNRAVILNDEVISENPEGGTGKGLFVQGLRQIRKVAILDGKNFDDRKSFPYQTVSQDTQILVFDDVNKNFDFENKFSIITEGITLERKNKDAIKLPVENSPKVLITTNYAIKGGGNSHDRRRYELEFAQFYNRNRTPVDEFGRQLFDDWDTEHFTRFDNYMIKCIQKYLKKGLIDQNAKNLGKRRLISETSHDFVEWMEDENYNVNMRMSKQEKHSKFINDYQDFKKLSQKRFTQWMDKYGQFMGYEVTTGNSNGDRWIMFEKEGHVEKEEEEVPF